jgi:deoxyribonuclease V
MKAALDVHYKVSTAISVCVMFDNWPDSASIELIRTVVPDTSPYQAGRFFKRELPCLLSVLQQTEREFETIVIDGYVHLKADAGKGLGKHLYESLSYKPVVVGVAKNPLKVADRFIPVHRGRSKKPLFISAIGCSVEDAVESILSMHGQYRIPTLLKIVDRYARQT